MKSESKTQKQNSSSIKKLIALATAARKNAYAPYSECLVGAALITNKGQYYSGCNVENASFGATVCAERGAIQQAITHQGKIKIKEILIATNVLPPWYPCGMCRQVIAEFSTLDTRIHLYSLKNKKIYRSLLFSEIYPSGFTPTEMNTQNN